MIYLKKFELLDEIQEHYLFDTEKRKIFNFINTFRKMVYLLFFVEYY